LASSTIIFFPISIFFVNTCTFLKPYINYNKMAETIGLKEGWIEQGLTEKQMMNRIKELNLPTPWCSMEPYPLNFLQSPNLNSDSLKRIVEMKKLTADTGAWIAASNLWTPGQTINIVFANSNLTEFIKATLLKYLQPHVSMKLVFPGGSSGNILVNVTSLSGQGGNSALGKTGSQQTVNLSGTSMSNADINYTGKFSWARYLVCHEFGHAMGLYHEWNREMCSRNGATCSSAQDLYSVMNYPAGSTGGAADAKPSANCMDSYSPTDIQWLEKVYGKGTQPPPGTQRPQPPPGTQRPQPPPGTQKPKPQPGTQRPKPQPRPPPGTQRPIPPPPNTIQPPPPVKCWCPCECVYTPPPGAQTQNPPSPPAPIRAKAPVANSSNIIAIVSIIIILLTILIVFKIT
jgi:hypothetical protein